MNFFGQNLDDLVLRHNHQLPPVITQLLDILYLKGPETTGIFRKVANARSVKDCIERIERNIPLQDEELHPILAAGIFKVNFSKNFVFLIKFLLLIFSIFYVLYLNQYLILFNIMIGKNVFDYQQYQKKFHLHEKG